MRPFEILFTLRTLSPAQLFPCYYSRICKLSTTTQPDAMSPIAHSYIWVSSRYKNGVSAGVNKLWCVRKCIIQFLDTSYLITITTQNLAPTLTPTPWTDPDTRPQAQHNQRLLIIVSKLAILNILKPCYPLHFCTTVLFDLWQCYFILCY